MRVRPSGRLTRYESLGHEAHVRIWTDVEATRGLGSPQRQRRHQTHGDDVLWAAAEPEEPEAQDRENQWHSQSRRLDDETSGWKTFDDVVRLVQRQTHRPSTDFSSAADDGHWVHLMCITSVGGDDTGKRGSGKRNRHAFWSRTRDVDSMDTEPTVGRAAGWITEVIMTCCIHYESGTAVVEIWKSR